MLQVSVEFECVSNYAVKSICSIWKPILQIILGFRVHLALEINNILQLTLLHI